MIKQVIFPIQKSLAISVLSFILIFGFQHSGYATNKILNDTIGFNQYKGKVVDSKSKKALIFASLTVSETNISTVTNTQGEFLLKVPKKFSDHSVIISFLGYTSQVINLTDFKSDDMLVKLETRIEELSEVRINVKDAKSLVLEVLKRRGENYFNDHTTMTAFHRETIKKRRTYVSLSEAVVAINKQPYTSLRNDIIKLHKARKSTDYTRLDTIALKLKGGPFSTLYLDIIKNPTMFLTDEIVETYDFSFDTSTKIDNRPIYVVNFKQKRYIDDPLYYGKLFIDAQSLALTSAKFQLNLDDQLKASRLFIIRKPRTAKVLPTEAVYQVDYRVKDGKWFFAYSRIQLTFKIKYDKKLFNSIYHTTIEMAITDWEKNITKELFKAKERLRPSVILSDEASGFSDPEFWGEYNVIEPEKSIEVAIRKIQKQLKRIN
jgi:hypothetical protein